MNEKIIFNVNKRETTGKKVKKLRKQGLVPGTVYGSKHEPINIELVAIALEKLLRQVSFSTPITLDIDGKAYLSIIKKITHDPIYRTPTHIDFQTISAKELIDAEVEIKLTDIGSSVAEKNSLVIMQVLEKIELRALPHDMPTLLEISIKDLAEVGQRLTLADLKLPTGVNFTEQEVDLTLAIANVYDPAQLEAQNEAAAGEAESVADVKSDQGSADEASPADAKK